jgi:hypothetical protein
MAKKKIGKKRSGGTKVVPEAKKLTSTGGKKMSSDMKGACK